MDITKTISKNFGFFKNIPFLPIILDEQMKIYTLFFRPQVFSKMIDLTKWIKEHEGVSTKYHKYGGIEFVVNQKEICHIHGDGLVDVILDKKIKEQFIGQNAIEEHHVISGGNMISYQLTKNEDLNLIKKIIKLSYEKKSGAS